MTFTDEFNFDLPTRNIALAPARPRDDARLLIIPATQRTSTSEAEPTFESTTIASLPNFLRPGDLVIANDTAVIKANLQAKRGSATIGITLDRILPNGQWHALARNARRLRARDILTFQGDDVTAVVITNEGHGSIVLSFSVEGAAFDAFLERRGVLALPPYISRPTGPTAQDDIDYHTIFAREKGAVAAPTAGLHFTPELLAAIDAAGAQRCTVTLHVGAGTFLPVRSDTLDEHVMHAEWGSLSAKTATRINETRANGGRIVAIGTTTLRLLESAAAPDGRLKEFHGETAIFITPGYRFKAVDILMTNFHLPRSTLFMLVSAFAGLKKMKRAYQAAIEQDFRFYSYGDACLIYRDEGTDNV